MESNIVSVSSDLSLTHYFIYKGKQYPFNIVIFNLFSRFFTSNQQFKPESGIKLLEDREDDIDIPESSIKDFVNYCQNQNINLSKENVFFVHKLAKKFIVPSLIKAAENFITINRKELVIEYLNLNSDQQKFNSTEFEEMIAMDLAEYVKNDKLISLPFQAIHKIVTKYQQKMLDSKSEHPSEIIDFLFKCLDRFDRKASVFFENFDFGNLNGAVIHRLLTKYSEKFDFHFINASCLKTVYKLESDLIEREEMMKVKLNQIEQKIELITRENKNDEINQILADLSDKLNREIQSKNNEINQINDKYNELKIEMDGMKNNYENQIDSLKDEFTRQMTNLTENVRRLTEKVEEQTVFIDQLKAEIEEEKRKPLFSCQFTNNSDPKGIISILDNEVSLSAGGSHYPSHPLSNIKKNDYTYFCNYYNTKPSSEKDSYILFDFGNWKKIDLYSYLIRSYGNSPSGNYQPKTWRVEGSNDNLKWDPLDRRVNDPTLNASWSFIQHNFSCQQNNHLIENRYRYIRYVQEDSWVNGSPYHVLLTYFELYGNVYN